MEELEGFVNRQNLTQYKDLFKFLTKHTGVPVKSSMIALALYHHLKIQVLLVKVTYKSLIMIVSARNGFSFAILD